ncbi:MAG: hypothetical protein C5B50_07775 [Verrucomicrobia bacterium]|nr:MAG: hypothetical protein C5B50_07775 [Verrucomicrobiota bacterium]
MKMKRPTFNVQRSTSNIQRGRDERDLNDASWTLNVERWMFRLFLAPLLLCAFALSSSAQTPIWFNMSEVTGSGAARAITITPLDGPLGFYGTNIAYSGPITVYPTNTPSGVTALAVTNLVAGNYQITFAGLPQAMNIFWPGDPSITNAADVRIQRSGIVDVFSISTDSFPHQLTNAGNNFAGSFVGNFVGNGSGLTNTAGLTNSQVLTGIPSSTNGNFAGNFVGNLIGNLVAATNYQGTNLAGPINLALGTNMNAASLSGTITNPIVSPSIIGNGAGLTNISPISLISPILQSLATNNAATLTNVLSTNVIYSSKLGCSGDSDLVLGGGHDDRAKLQGAIDQATNGPVEVIIERPTLISTGLTLRSNLRLRGLPGAGLYLAGGANTPVLWNCKWTGTAISPIGCTNVVVENLTLNQNPAQQYEYIMNLTDLTKSTWNHCVLVAVGDNVTLRNVTTIGSRHYAFLLASLGNVLLESCVASNNVAATNHNVSHDAFHFWGNFDSVKVYHCRSANCDDNELALNLNEGDADNSQWSVPGYFIRTLDVQDFQGGGGGSLSISFLDTPDTHTYGDTGYVYSATFKDIRNSSIADMNVGSTPARSFQIGNFYLDGFKKSNLSPAVALDGMNVGSALIKGAQGVFELDLDENNTNVIVTACDAIPDTGDANAVVSLQNIGTANQYPHLVISGCQAHGGGTLCVGGSGGGTVMLSGNQLAGTTLTSGTFFATPSVGLLGPNIYNGVNLTNVTAKALSDGGVTVTQSGGVLNITAPGTGDFVQFGADANGNGLLSVPQVSGGAAATNKMGTFIQVGNHTPGFIGDGNGLTNLNAGNFTSGTVPEAVLTNAAASGLTLDGITTNRGSVWTGGLRNTNFATGNWITLTNGAATLGPTNAGANVTLDGVLGNISFAGTASGNGSGLTNLSRLPMFVGTVQNGTIQPGGSFWPPNAGANSLFLGGLSTIAAGSVALPYDYTLTNLYVWMSYTTISPATNISFTVYTNGAASNYKASVVFGTSGTFTSSSNTAVSVFVPKGTPISMCVSNQGNVSISGAYVGWSSGGF